MLTRYGITLRHPEQPLLRLKQGHNAHNLFLNVPEEGWFFLTVHWVIFYLLTIQKHQHRQAVIISDPPKTDNVEKISHTSSFFNSRY